MLINTHDCYSILFKLQDDGIEIKESLNSLMTTGETPKLVIDYLLEHNNIVVEFYKRLNNKAHKIIKELLECDGKSISTYIKIATSLITQSIITIEHESSFIDDVDSQNNFIECIGLSELSQGLHNYFSYNDASVLVNAVNRNKKDLIDILGKK